MFKKMKEDFTCENCGEGVEGNGYTNHCPHCLWSKHVDNDPGDRAAECGGMMCPIGTEESGGEWKVVQECKKCGQIRKNKLSVTDNFDKIISITKKS